ncbi:bifunctional epoxide hydrolase 2-like, partial [Manacus vitellinus]|uniref:bifunctional epoxide hydrolase 2-like n=1 Tax=Manacus vitellinus TaxID=328815 RepID=UPI00115E76DB
RIGTGQPDPGIYSRALEELRAEPREAILLDEVPENLEPARELGMATILVRDTDTALAELEELAGLQLRSLEEPIPTPCDPSDVAHGYVPIRVPGNPWDWEWGGSKGYPGNVWDPRDVLDILGMSGNSLPAPAAHPGRVLWEWGVSLTCLFPQGIPQAVLVGHDWGGAVVWNMALFHPDRVRWVPAFQGLGNSGIRLIIPAGNAQGRGLAELSVSLIPNSGITLIFPAGNAPGRDLDELAVPHPEFWDNADFSLPSMPPQSQWIPVDPWIPLWLPSQIPLPALMVTAGKDPVLLPSLSKGMENWIPRLRREHLEECGHWTQMERPAEVNRILLEWLEGLPPDVPFPGNSRL